MQPRIQRAAVATPRVVVVNTSQERLLVARVALAAVKDGVLGPKATSIKRNAPIATRRAARALALVRTIANHVHRANITSPEYSTVAGASTARKTAIVRLVRAARQISASIATLRAARVLAQALVHAPAAQAVSIERVCRRVRASIATRRAARALALVRTIANRVHRANITSPEYSTVAGASTARNTAIARLVRAARQISASIAIRRAARVLAQVLVRVPAAQAVSIERVYFQARASIATRRAARALALVRTIANHAHRANITSPEYSPVAGASTV